MMKRVVDFMEQYHMVRKGDHLCVGLSGGADSVCLFLLLEEIKEKMGFSMSAVHIEHGIRGKESLLDAQFAERLAKTRGVPFFGYHYPVAQMAKERKLSLEEAGRIVRYEAFQKEAARYGAQAKIALAHHGDDNAETVLFHLCRGSGIKGICGIPPVRGNIIRPLLCVEKREIEAFLKEKRQPYREDQTNFDAYYSRNKIRMEILPKLKSINPQTVSHINRLSEDANHMYAYWKEEALRALQKHMQRNDAGNVLFRLLDFATYPVILKEYLLLEALEQAAGSRKNVTREHVAALADLAEGETGRKISLPYGLTAEKSYGELRFFTEKSLERKTAVFMEIPLKQLSRARAVAAGNARCRILEISKKDVKFPKNPYTKWFDYDKIKGGLCLRTRKQGDFFAFDQEGRVKKLKDYWIHEKVPRSKRDTTLLLAEGSHILWIVGYRVSEYYKITEQTKRILEVRVMEEEG